jgi:hypothetical protein
MLQCNATPIAPPRGAASKTDGRAERLTRRSLLGHGGRLPASAHADPDALGGMQTRLHRGAIDCSLLGER